MIFIAAPIVIEIPPDQAGFIVLLFLLVFGGIMSYAREYARTKRN
jgi:hypothetical protein